MEKRRNVYHKIIKTYYIRELKTKTIVSKSHIMPGGNRHIVERHILKEMGIRAHTGIFKKAFYKNKISIITAEVIRFHSQTLIKA